ncbi:hypothetical protein BDQ17DRAFT_1392177 [Cyathus striatus]|nr:hypothetical protein BDQ17DRAFT_1392177 [Cyathus striatus]
MITSIALNLRSQRTNYHQAINSLIFWDNCMPKRLIQMLNQFGICTSYVFQINGVKSLSQSASEMAKEAANNSLKIKMLPYDNFNWMSNVWESSALHKSQTHDQVSALLVILPTPTGQDAKTITAIPSFKEKAGTWHKINPRILLTDIIPSKSDNDAFWNNAILHVQNIIFEDLKAIQPLKTEEYYLPTFDQEQGSTRGNMIVLEHYFGKVLAIPKKTFEDTMFTVLGDRLTVAHDHAAQDQHSVDLSPYAFDHLSSLCMVGGIMHYEMNYISALSRNFWGSDGSLDPVSLSTFHKLLPNCAEVNSHKINYYAWMRFLDVILQGLALSASMAVTKTSSLNALESIIQSDSKLLAKIAAAVVDNLLVQPLDRLEDLSIKKISGETRGHPTFFKCYNYANECMEILHNIIHDWPSSYAEVAFNGMFFNPHGWKEDFKPTDLHVEHLNNHIKERAHGSNASPSVLEKIVPAMGYVQNLTDFVFEEMGVEDLNQHHSHVKQKTDIAIVIHHMQAHNIFDFAQDKKSLHTVIDLYRHGLQCVGGLNERHTNISSVTTNETEDEIINETELKTVEFTLGTVDEDWNDVESGYDGQETF